MLAVRSIAAGKDVTQRYASSMATSAKLTPDILFMDNASAFEIRVKQGLIYTMRLLQISRRSEANIRAKLKEKGYEAEVANRVVELLKERRLLSDLALAKDFTYWATHGKLLGKRRIRLDLKKRGVGESSIADALEASEGRNERSLAMELARERHEKFKALEPLKRKKRLYDFLVRRGFDYDICRSVVNELEMKT